MIEAQRPVGYYVHDHGAGHRSHALALARALGAQLVGLSSTPRPAAWPGDWVDLPSDADPYPTGDPARNGAWHWVPTDHAGFGDRMRSVATWVSTHDPAAMVSDVSVEILVLASLLGVPTAAVMLHGQRSDRAHRLAWDTADLIIAPWPATHGEPWQNPWSHKLHHIGLLSRYDHCSPPPPVPSASDTEPRALLIAGHGCDAGFVRRLVESVPQWRWDVVGAMRTATAADPGDQVRWHGPVDDLWPLLCSADVVISGAGAATVAEIAAARRPSVLVPLGRPFDEQRAAADHLAAWAPVVVVDDADQSAARWAKAISQAAGLDGSQWGLHHDGLAGERFIAALERLLR